MIRIPIGLSLVVGLASCVIPPPPQAQQPLPWGAQPAVAPPPQPAESHESSSAEVATVTEAPSTSTRTAGRWVSTEWASVTNPAMTSADFYLTITVGNDGGFHGSWARYICLSEAYGIISCSLGPIEGSASGRLDAGGGGRIELDRLGSSALSWTAKSATELSIELPRDWLGDRVLFRSSVKR